MPFKPNLNRPTDGQTPLRDFWGRLGETEAVERKFEASEERQQAERTQQSVLFKFDELDVLVTTEPWPLPTAEISIPFSERSATRWAAFVASVRPFIDSGQIVEFDDLVGKRLHMVYKEATLLQVARGDDGEELSPRRFIRAPGEAWQVAEIAGLSAGTSDNIEDKLVELALGKTDDQFFQAVFTSDLRSHPKFGETVVKMNNKTLLSELEGKKLLVKTAEGLWARP